MAAKRGIRAYSLFIRFLRLFLGVYLKLRFNMKAENHGLVARLRPPYLVLPNHVGYWDPFMVSIFVPQAIHWVAADANFRSRTLRRLLGLVGAIPKAKAVTDFEAIRYILSVRESGGVVGIFAEGQRTWDGTTLPLLYSTAKLVRLMKAPVVTPIFLGGYFSHPRWSYKPRRGELTVRFKLALTAEEARSFTVDQIYERLSEALDHDDYAYQSSRMIRYQGRRIAEDLEHSLFVCPDCRGIGTMRSRVSYYRCRRCGYAVRYTETGFLTSDEGPHFSTIRDWHRWQLEELPALLDERVKGYQTDGTPILEDVDIDVSWGYRSSRLTRLGRGTLRLLPDKLALTLNTVEESDAGSADSPEAATGADTGRGASRLEIPLSEIRGLNVQLTRHLELYYKGQLYVFFPASRKVSAYKWQNAVEVLTQRTVAKEQ
jgi:1-acyl-sn-glycerol-3-phosphate acyltransferase